MSNRKTLFGTCAVAMIAAAVTIGSFTFADEAMPAAAPAGDASDAAAKMAADMAKYAELAKPGPQHAALAKCVGDWTAEAQCWMDPSMKEPMKSTGKLHNEMALGGRYLMGNYEGEMMGKPFKGMSCTGYDNAKKKYFSAWIDEMSTGCMMVEGDADASGKVITLTGEFDCPIQGKMKIREVVTFVDDDHHKFEMYMTPVDAKEMKSMEINYTRVK